MATYTAGSAAVDVWPSFTDFQKKVQAFLATVDEELTVDLVPQLSADFAAELSKELDRVNADFAVDIVPGAITGFAQQLNVELQKVNADFAVDIVPEFSADFGARVRAMGIARTDQGIPVDIVPEFGSDFQARIRAIAIARGLSIPVELDPIIDAGLQARINALAQAHNLHVNVALNVNQSALGSLRAGADNAHRSLTGMGAVKFTGLFAGITALIGALGGLVGIAGGAAAGLSAIGAAGVIGSTGLIDAFSTMKTASDQSTNSMIANAKAIESAEEALADARENATRTAVRGQEQLESAQRRTSQAERSHIQSQRDLSAAYKDAKRDIDDLNDSLRSQVLSEKEAELAVADAYDAMVKSRTDGSSGRDQQRAFLDYQRALITLDEQRKRTADLKTETQGANTAGVEGSRQVLEAKEQVAEADQRLLDARTEEARTQRDVAEANADAQKQIERAQDGVTEAVESGNSAANDFADALAKLAPNAQQFVLAMQALGPQWNDLRMAVQDNLFGGIGDSITTLADNQLPYLQDMLVSTAGSMNGAFKDTLGMLDETLTGLVESGAFEQFKTAVGQSMSGLAPLVSGLVTGFTELGIQVLPTLGPLFASLGDAFASMAPALGTIGASLSGALTDLMPHLAGFISALAEGLAPVMPVLGQLLASLGAALTPLIPPLSELLVVVGTALSEALVALAPAIGPLGEAFTALVTAIAPILPLVAQVISELVQALAPALTTIFEAAAPVISQLVEQMGPIFEQMAPVISEVAGILAQALAGALTDLAPILPIIVDSFSRIVMAVAPFLPQLVEITAQLLPPLIELFGELITTWLPPLTTAFEWIAKEVLPWVIVAVQDLADTWSDRFTAMSNYLRDARQFIGDAVDGIAGFFTGLRDTVSEVWDKVVSTIAKAIGAIGDMMKRVEWVPGAGSIRNLGNNLVTWARANGYADGGYITGPGGPRDDLVPAYLSNGEYVVNAAATEQNLPLLEAINSGNVPRFADGGRVALDRGISQAQQYHGQAYDYGGYTGGVDCSLLASKITAALLGLDTGTRLFNTESDFEAMGWRPGLDLDGWSVGIFRGGGGPNSHMAGTLGRVPVESSGAGVFYGPPAAGADDPQFDLHYYLPREMWNPPDPGPGSASAPAEYDPNIPEGPTGTPGSYLSGGSAGTATLPDYESAFTPPGSGEGSGDLPSTISGLFGDAAKAAVEGQLSDVFDVIGLPDKVPPIVQLGVGLVQGKYRTPEEGAGNGVPPKGESYLPETPQQDPLAGGQWTTRDQSQPPPSITSAAPNPAESGHVYNPAGGVEQWRGTVESVLNALAMPSSWADPTLAQMDTESGGNPQAINNWDSNAAAGTPSKGLMQVIDPTFDMLYPQFSSAGFPDDIWDPRSNIAGGLSWMQQQYGGPDGVWGQGHGYANGGFITGPGGPRDDVVPIWASNGEFMVNAEATARNRPLLEAINSGAAHMAAGGMGASPVPAMAGASAAVAGPPTEYHTHYHVEDMSEAVRKENQRRHQEMQTYLRR